MNYCKHNSFVKFTYKGGKVRYEDSRDKGSVLEGTDFEDSIRNAVSIGGDSDTIAAMAGGIAEAYWGIPESIREIAMRFLDEEQIRIIAEFEGRFGR